MSFEYNPLKHIEIVTDYDLWSVFCHGCGAMLKPHSPDTPLTTFIENITAHIKSSHNGTKEDFKGWSKF